MSTQAIYRAVLRSIAGRETHAPSPHGTRRHLDVGAGRGELIGELRKCYGFASSACDFHVERFALDDIRCRKLDLDREDLPYPPSTFDVVTCSEVIEHLENYRRLIREIFRVVTPGGLAVLTTPNVLNAKSRVRYLLSGFGNLFGPLPVKNDKLYSTGGHITPIPYFYLAHALLDAGFVDVACIIDKPQKTSILWLLIVGPFIFVNRRFFMLREQRRFRTITAANQRHVAAHFSTDVLLGRTVVVSATKPRGA